MSLHNELLQRHRAVMPDWMALYYEEPIAIARGAGCRVWDAEGKEYLDFFGGILTTMTGHAVPEVVEAVQQQAERIMHSSTLYLIEAQIALAEEIARLAPIGDAKVFFTTSGTEANEAALLLACTARRSNQVLAIRNSYHGRSFATMAITGNRNWSASNLSPVDVKYVHGGYRFRSPYRDLDDAAYISACVEDLKDVITTQTSGDVACLIVEPIQGVGGFAVPPDGLFGAMKDVCDQHGILFIADEVQTGWGRTGEHFWGIEAHGCQPDILTFAKGIGNGLALAGVVAPAELMDGITANSISTFGGSPLAATGGLANLRYVLEHELQANAAEVGAQLIGDLRAGLAEVPAVGEIRGKGLMVGIEFVQAPGRDPDRRTANEVLERCRTAGLLVGKGGLHGNVLRIAPPLTLSADQAAEGAKTIIAAIEVARKDDA